MSKLLIYVELSAEEKEGAIQAFKIAHNDVFDPQFAPDRAWVEGYAYARAAVQAAQPEAVGWKLMPIEPTPDMLDCIVHRQWPADWEAGKRLQRDQRGENRVPFKTEYEEAAGQYLRMLASAPTPEPMSAPTAEHSKPTDQQWSPSEVAMFKDSKQEPLVLNTIRQEQAEASAVQMVAAGELRAFLERTLAAMEGVIDVADRKTVEFDALRSCVVDLTLMLLATPPSAATPEPSDAERLDMMGVLETLAIDIEAMDVMHWGDPRYEHDGYYMRKEAAKVVRNLARRLAADAAIRATKGGKL